MFNKKCFKFFASVMVSVLSFYISYAFGDAQTLGTVATNVSGTLSNVIKLLTAGAYVAGFGLTVGALFKFKQHKDNPQQVQLGTCIAMLLVGVCLIFLPSIVSTGGATIFGTSAVGSSTGQGTIAGFGGS